jgi:hypothetical protein
MHAIGSLGSMPTKPRPTKILQSRAARVLLGLGVSTPAIAALVAQTSGSAVPAWSHWWCSPNSASLAPHLAAASGVGPTLLVPTKAIAVHWPHFLPILLGLATLAYLWRADAQHKRKRAEYPLR